MSFQFGRWNFQGKPIDRNYLDGVAPVIAPYGPDGGSGYTAEGISIVYRAFHTTGESRREAQPHITETGAVITWDGILDNRDELIGQLRDFRTSRATDVAIVAAAYERWDTDCFGKLIGDWTLSIWEAKSQSLILAKDPIGTRHLYYYLQNEQVTWSTVLDPLVLFAENTLSLCEEYIAGWFAQFPATHLTPYVGIDSVPPSSFVLIRCGRRTVRKYWDFDSNKLVRYRTDREYEEHFRAVFAEAVRRRLRSDSPILAELSGGMDSSSIVCMADTIIASGNAATPRLDTVSYYDDSEPNWNERPFFAKVEEGRGRTGTHIDVGSPSAFGFGLDCTHFSATPGSGESPSSEASREFANCVISKRIRIVLSGIGGDEVTGGVPTPRLELEDLLARARFRTLAHQLKVWALIKRKPWFHLLFEALGAFLPFSLTGVPDSKRPAAWLDLDFVARNRAALRGYGSRLKLFSSLPSFQENISTLDGLRRQIGCTPAAREPLFVKRYPFCDRDLMEFLYSVPREQLVRPGQRRSLMRRALQGIVPDEVLDRKRKAYLVRRPTLMMRAEGSSLVNTGPDLVTALHGIVNREQVLDALQRAIQGDGTALVPLTRVLLIEGWLRNMGRTLGGTIALSRSA